MQQPNTEQLGEGDVYHCDPSTVFFTTLCKHYAAVEDTVWYCLVEIRKAFPEKM